MLSGRFVRLRKTFNFIPDSQLLSVYYQTLCLMNLFKQFSNCMTEILYQTKFCTKTSL